MTLPDEGVEVAQSFDPRQFLASVTDKSGVYVFYDAHGNTLYVGKAKNLKKRVASYFKPTGLTPRAQLMVSKIHRAETQQTRSESEALLLENNLIKAKRPRYNISLRDDKSFPYIRFTQGDRFPRFAFYRGRRSHPGKYYGPYPNAAAVREMLGHLHTIFRLRQCNDAFFRSRSRPCLQYQIKRCSAPCVGRITPQRYAEDVHQATAMLTGKDNSLVDTLVEKMERASGALEFELAATYRDRLALLQRLRDRQYVTSGFSDADAVAVSVQSGMVCFGVMVIRQGCNLGSHFHIQSNALDQSPAELLEAFVPQNYLGKMMPKEILLSEPIDSRSSLQQVLSIESRKQVVLKSQVRAHRLRWLESARLHAADHLAQHLNQRRQLRDMFVALAGLLNLDEVPARMECFDISHTMGERTVGACVVFDHQGPVKSDYRRFNVADVRPGDDYAAMRQVLTRRYSAIMENREKLPDVVIIDGGKGQLGIARQVFEELQIDDSVTLLGVSKGRARRAGEEQLHLLHAPRPIVPGGASPAAHLIQRIRDEAHRFAITAHRQRRAKARTRSPLERIDGIGEKRRRNLLRHFGGLNQLKCAGIEDLAKVTGISRQLAEKIFDQLHR